MNILEIIKSRRSIRRFKPKTVPTEALEQILKAIQWSPSWANTQCWEVVLVRDPSTKMKIQGALKQGNRATNAVIEAPILIVFCTKLQTSGYYTRAGRVTTKFGDWFMYDLGLATQSACLMAHALGLGTVILGLFDHDKVKEILGVPAGYEVVTIVPLGYPAEEPNTPRRREIPEFTHEDRFSPKVSV